MVSQYQACLVFKSYWILMSLLIASALSPTAANDELARTVESMSNWDLDEIYPDEASWVTERVEIEARLEEIAGFDESTSYNAYRLASLLSLVADARMRAAKMAKVGLLQSAVDTTSEVARSRQNEGVLLEARVESAVSFINPVVRNIGKEQLRRWLASNLELRKHERRINRILKLAPYAPKPETEPYGAHLSRLARTSSDAFEAITNASLEWPKVDVNGEQTALNLNRYRQLSRSPNVSVRRKAAETFLSHQKKLRDVFAVNLIGRIEGDLTVARHHNLDTSIDALLVLNDGMAEGAYSALHDAMPQAKDLVFRAAEALRRAHKLDEYTLDDLYGSPREISKHYSVEQAHKQILRAVEPLGEDYRDLMAERLDLPWMHIKPASNKAPIGGVYWQAGGGHPHTLFTYSGTFSHYMVYGGAAVLMMGYASVPEESPPTRREEDFSIFANTLWYLGALLSAESALETSDNREERIYILSTLLTRILTSVYDNALISELESELTERTAAGKPVSGADISAVYSDLLEKYYGGGPIRIPAYQAEAWTAHPTFFYGSHYTTWSLAMITALALQDGLKANDQLSIDAIRDGIGRSPSHFSAEVLEEAALDVSSPALYTRAYAQMERVVALLEAELN